MYVAADPTHTPPASSLILSQPVQVRREVLSREQISKSRLSEAEEREFESRAQVSALTAEVAAAVSKFRSHGDGQEQVGDLNCMVAENGIRVFSRSLKRCIDSLFRYAAQEKNVLDAY